MGEDFTAKDFRTWGATLHAAAVLGGTPAPRGENKRACTTHINKVIESVAETLCNTPAVCRKSYINPVIFELWRSGGLKQIPVARAGRTSRRVEQAVARILRRHGRSSAHREAVTQGRRGQSRSEERRVGKESGSRSRTRWEGQN